MTLVSGAPNVADYFRDMDARFLLRIPLLFLLTAWGLALHAQVNLPQARKDALDELKTMPERVAAFESLTEELQAINTEEVIHIADQLLQEFLHPDQEARVLARKARAMRTMGQAQEAYDLLSDAIDSWENLEEEGLCRLYMERGLTAAKVSSLGQKVEGILNDLYAALDIAEVRDNMALRIEVHDKLGYAYGRLLKDDQTAIEYYRFILLNSTSELELAQARVNVALLLDADRSAQNDTALYYLQEARKVFEANNRQSKVGIATLNIGRFYREAGKFDEAIEAYTKALNQVVDLSHQVQCHEYLGYIAYRQGRYDEAYHSLQTALAVDAENGGPRNVYLNTKLGEVYTVQGRSEFSLALCDSMRRNVENAPSLSNYGRATRLTDCWDCIGHAQVAMEDYKAAIVAFDIRDSARAEYERISENNQATIGLQVLEWETRRKQQMQASQYRLQEERQTYLYAIVALLIGFAMFITYRYRFTQRQSRLISTQRQQLQDRQRELIRANADLEIALNHKAVFLSNMSHEIRTPLNAIVGMSNLASKEDMTEVARKYLRNIITASSNLIEIVNDILDFSKLEAGKLEIACAPFSVQEALEVAENVMRIPAEQKDLSFAVESDSALPAYLYGDSSRLNQVLINLIGNAVKFTLSGSITVKATVEPLPDLPAWCPPPAAVHDAYFVVRVIDTGIGIPADKVGKVFESFNQGDSLKTRKFGGTGLGLSISKQIIELQDGVIWVESVEDEGSTFAFALPAKVATVDIEDDGDQVVREDVGAMRILIAEDNPFNVIVTEDTLRSEFKEVTIGKAENGRIAYEKVRDEQWDLVLMDIHMPEMSGLEATAAIRKLPDERSRTLIVAMTASVLREETDNYMRHGMNGFIPKPFQVQQLRSEIQRLRRDQKNGRNSNRPALPPLKILIAEDNPFNVIVAEDTLKSELNNVTIGKAENGRIAVEMVRDGHWDVVLMDIAMPEMTGLEATTAIRKLKDPAKAGTTIIAMTASILKKDIDHYMKKGMDGYVPKPFKVDQLLSEIERAHLSKK